jgi:hypothetical protein
MDQRAGGKLGRSLDPDHQKPLSALGPAGSYRDIKAGRFYLPDALEGRRETLVTSVLDAEPHQCLRVGGTSVLTIPRLCSAAFSSR